MIRNRVRFECQTKALTNFECQTQGSNVRLTGSDVTECKTNSNLESYIRTVSDGHSAPFVSGSNLNLRLKRGGARVNFQVQDTLRTAGNLVGAQTGEPGFECKSILRI